MKTYTFSPNTSAVASQVNSDVDTIINFINTSVVQADGSQAMTGILVLPAFDPTSANQATRKSYVDATAAAAASAAIASGNALLKFIGFGTPIVGGAPTAGADIGYQSALAGGTTDGTGDLQINFPVAFANGVIGLSAALVLQTAGELGRAIHPWSFTTSGFKARLANTTNATSVAGTGLQVVWTAFGW